MSVRLFPVSETRLGAPEPAIWDDRRTRIGRAIDNAPDEGVRGIGREYLQIIDEYRTEATKAGHAFVEIQNTMLLATVGQRSE